MAKEMWESIQGLRSDERDARLLHILKANPGSMGVAQRVYNLAESYSVAEEAALERMANLQKADYSDPGQFDEIAPDLAHVNTGGKLF